MSDEVLAMTGVLSKKLTDTKELIGDEETPIPGDETLQRQHKQIENYLANLTGGSFHTADDVVPEEHTFSQMWEAVNNTIDITHDENNYIVMLSKLSGASMKVSKLNMTTGEMIEGATLDLQETVDQTYGAFLIERCENKYAVLYHKMTYTTSATELPYYAESVNEIYIFSQSFVYESTIDCSSLVAGGGVRGIGWDGTNLKLLVHTPKVFDENQYGFADRFISIDLSGAIIAGSEVLLTTGQTAISSPVSNKHTLKQKICVNSLLSEIYMPKILFSQVSSRIWGVNGAGVLNRIFRFTDMLGGTVTSYNKLNSVNSVITSCMYLSKNLYILINPDNLRFPIIAKAKINF